MKTISTLLLLAQLTSVLGAQARRVAPHVVVVPNGPVTRVSSPDKKWTLIFECASVNDARKLWIEDNGTQARRLVKEYERGADISWAPNSRLFFVNDASGSTETLAYVYEPVTLKETAVAKLLLARDPNVARYLGAGHSYLDAKRWINSQELLVVLEGHFDEERVGFYIKYRVDLSGRVHRLYKRIDRAE